MKTILIEIRAAEGGRDSKNIVNLQVGIYTKFADRRCL